MRSTIKAQRPTANLTNRLSTSVLSIVDHLSWSAVHAPLRARPRMRQHVRFASAAGKFIQERKSSPVEHRL